MIELVNNYFILKMILMSLIIGCISGTGKFFGIGIVFTILFFLKNKDNINYGR